jgi:hypothetical protein
MTSVHCVAHGESQQAYTCSHLLGGVHGLGFNSEPPSPETPFPNAWCDDCELIRAAHGGWNDKSEELASLSLICVRCYECVRIRNARTAVTLEEMAGLRWKCGSCEEWHTGPILDLAYDEPLYWTAEHARAYAEASLSPRWNIHEAGTFLNDDYCAIDDEYFFVRGQIRLPIIGTAEDFCWGVWGSFSRENFKLILKSEEDEKRVELPAMFSWLSTRITEYPDTASMKMYAHTQKPGLRPHFELERTDHPLSQEQYNGITPERVKEIMRERLQDLE